MNKFYGFSIESVTYPIYSYLAAAVASEERLKKDPDSRLNLKEIILLIFRHLPRFLHFCGF